MTGAGGAILTAIAEPSLGRDLGIVGATLCAVLSLPAFAGARSTPWAGLLLLSTGFGIAVWTAVAHPGPFAIEDAPRAFSRVFSVLLP